jgi:hypothetical protein
MEMKGLEDRTAKSLQLAVDRVLASSCFQRSPRLQELLGYLAEQTLKGDSEALKEAAIGHRLFKRPIDYSAAEDNIVRSNVRQLRLKLEEFYSTEGGVDGSRVTIPKGSYGIVLQEVAVLPRSSVKGSPEKDELSKTSPTSHRLIAIAIASWVICAALVLALLLDQRKGHGPSSLLALLAPQPGRRLLVVVPDANVQLYQRLTGHSVTLQDYIAHRFAQPEQLKQISPVFAHYADDLFHSTITQGFVLGLIPVFAQVVGPEFLSVRTPDTLAVKDFEGDNALLISGPYGDPWVQLFDHSLNFQIETGGDNRFAHIVNRKPQGNEKQEYWNFVDSDQTTICYARIAYLPGLTPGSRVLLTGGPHNASTEAASLFLTRTDSVQQLCRLFHVRTPSQLPWFELLVEARALGNSPWTMRILACRAVTTSNH